MDARRIFASLLVAAVATLDVGCAVTEGAGFSRTRAGMPDFGPLVERYGPAVVNVSVAAPVKGAAEVEGTDAEALAQALLQRLPKSLQSRGGSGFIVSSDGYMLSSTHVIDGAKEVRVRLADRREFKARVVGVDKASDVALLKAEATGLPTVKLGSAQALRPGDWVVAIGSPYGFENSASAGIVSATARALPDEALVPFLQTDVAVNPGNSGGPLFNARGEVVGMNAQIFSMTGGYQGISFAIPIDIAARVAQALQRDGRVARGQIGITLQEMNHRLAQSFGYAGVEGAIVTAVDGGGAAERAGLRPGDIIVGVGKGRVRRAGEVTAAIADTAPGGDLALRLWRDGAMHEVRAVVGAETPAANEDEPDNESPMTPVAHAEGDRLGMVLRPLTTREQYMIDAKGGLLVGGVTGAAAQAGILPGDVILSVNGKVVGAPEDVHALVTSARGAHVALLVQRGEGKVFVPVER